MSPYSAVSVLVLFKKGVIPLSEQTFEDAFDTITELLEQVNNERYRLRDQRKDT